MKECTITVDVHAHWSEKPPVYRVFVDDNLLTERDFIWSGGTFIRENIIVNLEAGSHTVKIEQTGGNGTVTAKNIVVDGISSASDFTVTE
jgi:hypothetical protein